MSEKHAGPREKAAKLRSWRRTVDASIFLWLLPIAWISGGTTPRVIAFAVVGVMAALLVAQRVLMRRERRAPGGIQYP